MSRKKLYGAIIGVIAFIILVIGATYAWFTWTSETASLGGTTAHFDIVYSKGDDISTLSLLPSFDKDGGLSTSVTINKTATSLEGTVSLYINNIRTTVVAGVCSNNNYYTEDSCVGAGAVWTPAVVDWSGLKWEVYETGVVDAIATGDFSTNVNNSVVLFTGRTLNNVATTYTVYIWLDGETAGNDYLGSTFNGKLQAVAMQTVS